MKVLCQKLSANSLAQKMRNALGQLNHDTCVLLTDLNLPILTSRSAFSGPNESWREGGRVLVDVVRPGLHSDHQGKQDEVF